MKVLFWHSLNAELMLDLSPSLSTTIFSHCTNYCRCDKPLIFTNNSAFRIPHSELMLDLSPSLSTTIFHTAQTIAVEINHDFTNNCALRISNCELNSAFRIPHSELNCALINVLNRIFFNDVHYKLPVNIQPCRFFLAVTLSHAVKLPAVALVKACMVCYKVDR